MLLRSWRTAWRWIQHTGDLVVARQVENTGPLQARPRELTDRLKTRPRADQPRGVTGRRETAAWYVLLGLLATLAFTVPWGARLATRSLHPTSQYPAETPGQRPVGST